MEPPKLQLVENNVKIHGLAEVVNFLSVQFAIMAAIYSIHWLSNPVSVALFVAYALFKVFVS